MRQESVREVAAEVCRKQVRQRPVTPLKVVAAGMGYQRVRVGQTRGVFVLARPRLKVGQHPRVIIVITELFQLAP
jgi:hypothetical protein